MTDLELIAEAAGRESDWHLSDILDASWASYSFESDRILINRLATALVAHQWQPIMTAPKNEDGILVMRNDWPGSPTGHAELCESHNTYVAAWWADEDGENGAWICYMDAIQDPECPIVPTHWMHLPAPPGVTP